MMLRALAAVLLGLLLAGCAVDAQQMPLGPMPAAPDAGLQPSTGAELPLDARFTDDAGRSAALREHLGGRTVLLVLGDFRCSQLCGIAMHSLLTAVHDAGIARREVRVLRVSIDPDVDLDAARARRDADLAFAAMLEGTPPPADPLDLRTLVGESAAVRRLAERIGYRYSRLDAPLPAGQRFAHPAVVVVATPDGRVSSYLPGIDVRAAQLRLAVVQASGGRIGGVADRLALLCTHLDATLGRHTALVLDGLRVMALAGVTALAWAAVRLERRRRPG
jgi:protein SCO1/2